MKAAQARGDTVCVWSNRISMDLDLSARYDRLQSSHDAQRDGFHQIQRVVLTGNSSDASSDSASHETKDACEKAGHLERR